MFSRPTARPRVNCSESTACLPSCPPRVSCSVNLFRVLRLTVPKRPVLFADFNQTNEHVLPAQAETLVQSVCDCFVKGTFLIHGSPSIERDLDTLSYPEAGRW